MLRLVVVDDEAAARGRLARVLRTEEAVALVGEFADGAAGLAGIRELQPDAVFLDIEMPELDGLAVAAALDKGDSHSHRPLVVFVTAFEQYAVRAFEARAVDYLLKPVDTVRVRETLHRVRERLCAPGAAVPDLVGLRELIEDMRQRAAGAGALRRRPYHVRLLVHDAGRAVMVPVAEIDWIEAAGNYVRIHRGAATHTMRRSLATLEVHLDPSEFARIHRGALINVARIKEVQPWFSGAAIVILLSGQRLKVSRMYRPGFDARFGFDAPEGEGGVTAP